MKVELICSTPKAEDFVVEIARVSSSRKDKKVEGDKLLKYLIANKHWSPFEHGYLTVKIDTSRAIGTQLLRHRSFTFQELSQRYADVSKHHGDAGMFEEIEGTRLYQNLMKYVRTEVTNIQVEEALSTVSIVDVQVSNKEELETVDQDKNLIDFEHVRLGKDGEGVIEHGFNNSIQEDMGVEAAYLLCTTAAIDTENCIKRIKELLEDELHVCNFTIEGKRRLIGGIVANTIPKDFRSSKDFIIIGIWYDLGLGSDWDKADWYEGAIERYKKEYQYTNLWVLFVKAIIDQLEEGKIKDIERGNVEETEEMYKKKMLVQAPPRRGNTRVQIMDLLDSVDFKPTRNGKLRIVSEIIYNNLPKVFEEDKDVLVIGIASALGLYEKEDVIRESETDEFLAKHGYDIQMEKYDKTYRGTVLARDLYQSIKEEINIKPEGSK